MHTVCNTVDMGVSKVSSEKRKIKNKRIQKNMYICINICSIVTELYNTVKRLQTSKSPNPFIH